MAIKNFLCALVFIISGQTFAQTATSPTVPDFRIERLQLNGGAQEGLTTATGDLLPAGHVRISVAAQYQKDPFVLRRNTIDAATGNTVSVRAGALIQDRMTLHLGIDVSPLSWFQLGVDVPFVPWQHGDDLTFYNIQTLSGSGVGAPEVHFRLGVLSQQGGGLIKEAGIDLALQFGAYLPLASKSGLFKDDGTSFSPRISLGRTFGAFRLGTEVGGEFRPTANLSSSVVAPGTSTELVSHQLHAGVMLGTTRAMMQALQLELSGRGDMSLGTVHSAGAEVFLGARVPVGPMELFAVGGHGFGNLVGIPRWRAIAGLAYAPRTTCTAESKHRPEECPDLDDDHDGIPNHADLCPTEAEDMDGFEDTDGCPDLDNDQDGVPDTADKCPNVAGLKEYAGCPPSDQDNDGVDDINDLCPTVRGLSTNRGCPLDSDKDGIVDSLDRCPLQAGPKSNGGCPVVDADGDGIDDAVDNCPNEKGPKENQGCPRKQMVVITKEKLIITDKVYFATNKSTIKKKSFLLLNQVSEVMINHPAIKWVTVEGHTDNKGRAESNRKLSQERAEAVREYLIAHGVDAKRLRAIGYGPDRPIDENSNEAGRANNRRVEFTIETTDKVETRDMN